MDIGTGLDLVSIERFIRLPHTFDMMLKKQISTIDKLKTRPHEQPIQTLKLSISHKSQYASAIVADWQFMHC